MKIFSLLCLMLTLGISLMASGVKAQNIDNKQEAIFAAGCFWCIEKDMEKLDGVIDAVSGYTGGQTINPTYQQVSRGNTGHREAIKVIYDPEKISYADLLNVFWRQHDPFDDQGQFCDKGFQYTAAVYYRNETEKALAEQQKNILQSQFKQEIVTAIEPAAAFYEAEEYHQSYYTKNPVRYRFYRWNCGRDQRLAEIWGDSDN